MRERKYQAQAIEFALDRLRSDGRSLIQLPTGSGKTLVSLRAAAIWLQRPRARVYLVTPSEETVRQTEITARILGMRPALDIPGASQMPSQYAPFVVTTYASAWRRFQRWTGNQTLLILDECHHVNFLAPVNADILNQFEFGLGLSATPWSKGCLAYFKNNKHTYKLSQAIADGVNAPYVIHEWADPVSGNYQMIYTNNQDYREAITRSLKSCDYAIYTRPLAREVIAKFRCGAIRTIVVNRMLTEGFDLPKVKRIWIMRDTKSRIAVMQMAGRALRAFQSRTAEIYVQSPLARKLLNQALERAES